MKHSILKHLLMVGLTIMLLRVALAQPTPEQPIPPHVWGVATNGLCVGVCVRQDDLYCGIDVRNITTNVLYIWVPRLDRRYEIEFRGPDGRRIPQLKPFLPNPQWGSDLSHFLARDPFAKDPFSERRELSWFLLKDMFDVRTNGQFTLIVSAQVNVFTNFSIGRSQMRREPTYFFLPAVTNTFNILPPNAQTN